MKIVSLFFFCLLFLACTREEYVPIDVSTTDSLAMSSQWAVIADPYASYFEKGSGTSTIVAYGRIGDVIEVIGSSIESNSDVWYKFENGWLSQNSIQIYANKLQADYAAKEVK